MFSQVDTFLDKILPNKTNKTPTPNFRVMSSGCFPETRKVFSITECMFEFHIDKISHNSRNKHNTNVKFGSETKQNKRKITTSKKSNSYVNL